MSRITNPVVTIPSVKTVEIVERPYPNVEPGYVLVDQVIAPVCNEGRVYREHMFELNTDDPLHLGHEGCGEIVEVPAGSKHAVGDRVLVFQADHCGVCFTCRNALGSTYCDTFYHPKPGKAPGLWHIEQQNESESGGFAFARYRLAHEDMVYKLPDDLEFRYAAAGNCFLGPAHSHQLEGGVQPGEDVLVGGVGFVGLGHVIVARYRRARVIVLARNEFRIELCRQLGVEHILNPDDPDWRQQLLAIVGDRRGVAFAADCSGSAYYQRRCIDSVGLYGTMCFAGHTNEQKIEVEPLNDIIHKHATWIGGHDVGLTERDSLVAMLQNPDVQREIDIAVTHEFPMSQAEDALILAGTTKQCGKIYLHPRE